LVLWSFGSKRKNKNYLVLFCVLALWWQKKKILSAIWCFGVLVAKKNDYNHLTSRSSLSVEANKKVNLQPKQ
jgi:uncharacterized membrane protein